MPKVDVSAITKKLCTFECIDIVGSMLMCGGDVYLVQKETQCFYLQFWGLKIIDFKNGFNSVVLPSNKDLDCIVSS